MKTVDNTSCCQIFIKNKLEYLQNKKQVMLTKTIEPCQTIT
jgi:hypothetical protein